MGAVDDVKCEFHRFGGKKASTLFFGNGACGRRCSHEWWRDVVCVRVCVRVCDMSARVEVTSEHNKGRAGSQVVRTARCAEGWVFLRGHVASHGSTEGGQHDVVDRGPLSRVGGVRMGASGRLWREKERVEWEG